MRVTLLLILGVGAISAADHGMTARFVPERVRPGEVFELRVEMARADYGRFALKVPPHPGLHRVAVEAMPVRLDAGVYRQRECWLLQADRAGEIVLEGMTAVMTTGAGEETVLLPPLRMEVASWGGEDASVAPVAFPPEARKSVGERGEWWWVLPVLVALVGVVLWLRRRAGTETECAPGGEVSMEEALNDLDHGRLRSVALERLLEKQRGNWPAALREMVEQAVYAGRGDAAELAARLRKEVPR